MIKKKRWMIGIMIAIFCVISSASVYLLSKTSHKTEYAKEVFLPFTRVSSDTSTWNDAEHNYWILGSYIIKNLISGEKVDESLDLLDTIMDVYEENGCFPREAYGNLEAGWVSSMDAPVIALACYIAQKYDRVGGYSTC